MALQEHVSDNVRILAAAQGTSPAAVAEGIGRSRQWLQNKLTGRAGWSVADLEAIAGGLGVEPATLMSIEWWPDVLATGVVASPKKRRPRQVVLVGSSSSSYGSSRSTGSRPQQPVSTSDLLTLSEVASRLGVKPALLRTWRNRGQGPRSFKIGASVVYLRRDVEKWEAAHREAESA
jgi:predicted DNA-binding transcriptional regulator AlpA